MECGTYCGLRVSRVLFAHHDLHSHAFMRTLLVINMRSAFSLELAAVRYGDSSKKHMLLTQTPWLS